MSISKSTPDGTDSGVNISLPIHNKMKVKENATWDTEDLSNR